MLDVQQGRLSFGLPVTCLSRQVVEPGLEPRSPPAPSVHTFPSPTRGMGRSQCDLGQTASKDSLEEGALCQGHSRRGLGWHVGGCWWAWPRFLAAELSRCARVSDGWRVTCSFLPFITTQQWQRRGLGNDPAETIGGSLQMLA